MQRLGGRLTLVAAVIGGVWIVWPRSPAAGDSPSAGSSSPSPTSALQWQGTASCASMACHNGNGPRGSKGSEYTTWVTDDKHARAYEVLFNERSQRIAKSLGLGPAEKAGLCLKCHAMNAPPALRHERFVTLADGVSCESCHGPAQHWLTRHYLPEWRQKSDADKEKLGMRPTKDLVARARVCVDCHVGTAGQDVNHDLIAAGHPRLNFEYGAYLANLPKHWHERQDRARYADFEARVWAIGQVVSAQAALELLAHRASAAEKGKAPWPEFAEYDCYACHHGLQGENNRPQRGFGGLKAGTLPWATWYYALLPQAAGRDVKEFAALDDLKTLMAKPYPDSEKVRAGAAEAAGRLRQLRTPGYEDAPAVLRLLRSLAADGGRDGDWDSAAQRYLALAAAYHTLGDMNPRQRDPRLKKPLEAMGKGLQFPKGFDSPPAFDPGSFRERLKEIQTHLGR